MENLSGTERKVLEILIKDASKGVSEIGDEINLSRQTVASTISSLRKKGIIKHFSIVLNHEKLGMDLPVLVFVRMKYVDIGSFKKLMEAPALKESENVHDVFTTSGDCAFGIFGWWANKEDYGIWKTKLIVQLQKIVDNGAFDLDELVIWDFYKHRGFFEIPENIQSYLKKK
jgi:DNA-binding Lrp family transcriptional regulator